MNIPKLEKNRCSVVIADYATGQVYGSDLTIFLRGQAEARVFRLFDSFSEAEEYAVNLVSNHPQFKCAIYGSEGQHLRTYNTANLPAKY